MLSLKLGQKIGSGRNLVTFSNKFSLSFDGVNDFVDLANARGAFDTGAGTISAWVKLNTTLINAPVFKWYVNANNQITIIYLQAANQLKFMYKGGGTNTQVVASSSIENDGNFHHVAMTWNTDANEFKAYVDGSQFGTTQTSFGTLSGTPTVFDLGYNRLSGSDFWNGLIDEVSVFNSVKNITDIYNSGTPTDLTGESGLTGYWRMEEGTGTTITSSTEGAETGTLTNGTAFSTTVP
tara:strand:- start:862 stop:1572 length:711 start_codon:yes stop_codon:yes gene_type:complete